MAIIDLIIKIVGRTAANYLKKQKESTQEKTTLYSLPFIVNTT